MWSPTLPLIIIATGESVSEVMKRNVSTTKGRGEQARNEFFPRITSKVLQIILSNHMVDSDSPENDMAAPVVKKPTLKYNDPIKRQKIIIFNNMTTSLSICGVPNSQFSC